MALTGTWPRSLDDKGRLAVPKRVRDDLGGETLKELFVAPWTDKSLAFFTPAAFETLADTMSGKSATKLDVRSYNRLFYARAERLDVDAQGRLRIPDRLRTFAELQRDVVLLGVNDHLELWEASRWDAYLNDLNPKFDEIAEHAYE
jgi:MraZ protein